MRFLSFVLWVVYVISSYHLFAENAREIDTQLEMGYNNPNQFRRR